LDRNLVLLSKGLCGLAGAIGEELRNRADRSVLQGNKADVEGRHLNVDLKSLEPKALTLEV
jgi:hypothetical protein